MQKYLDESSEQLYRVTALGRILDPTYPSNVAILVLAFLATVIFAVLALASGETLPLAVFTSILSGAAVFFAWMIGREIDPDHPGAALVAAPLAFIGILLLGQPNVVALLWVVQTSRLINRSVGIPTKNLDIVAVLGLTAWMSLGVNWLYGLWTTLALLLDSRLRPGHQRNRLYAGGALVLTVIALLLPGRTDFTGLGGPNLLGVLLVSVLFVPLIASSRRIRSVGDATGEPLVPLRVQAAQLVVLAAAVSIALWDSPGGVSALVSAWAAMLAASLGWIWRSVRGLLTR